MKLSGYVASVATFGRSIIAPMVTDAIGLFGCVLVVYGVQLIYLPAGYIAAGLMLLTGVWLGARRG